MKKVFVLVDQDQRDADLTPVLVFESRDEAFKSARLHNSYKATKPFVVVEVVYVPRAREAQKG